MLSVAARRPVLTVCPVLVVTFTVLQLALTVTVRNSVWLRFGCVPSS